MRDCARLRAPNEITAVLARDAFQRRASLFLLFETEAIKALLAKNIIYLCRRNVTHIRYQSHCALYIVFFAAYSRQIVLLCVGYN